jgi:lipoprotein-releasing system permease protein
MAKACACHHRKCHQTDAASRPGVNSSGLRNRGRKGHRTRHQEKPDGDDLIKLAFVAMSIRQGTLEGFEERQGVVIGSRLSKQLSLHAGDTIALVAPRAAMTPIGASPHTKSYKIAAVFESGMPEFDAGLTFMPLMEAQSDFDRSGQVTGIEVHIGEANGVAAFRQLVTEVAGRSVFVTDWRQRNATYFDTK